MDFTNDIKSGIKLTADAVTDVTQSVIEKSRLKAKANRIKQVIKSDTQRRELAYAELGKYFFENHKDLLPKELDETTVVIEKTTYRIDKATTRYFEIVTEYENISLASENTEKIKQIVTDKTQQLKKSTDEKITQVSTKTKEKASEISTKTKEKAKNIVTKAKDKIDDFKSYVANEEEVDEFSDYDDFDDFCIDVEDLEIKADDYESDAKNEAKTSDDIAVVTVDDEESPDEFEF